MTIDINIVPDSLLKTQGHGVQLTIGVADC